MTNHVTRCLPTISLQHCLMTALAILTAAPATAATWYVSPAGDDQNSGSSPATAWRTLQKAADVVGPGDRVDVLPGGYAGFNLFTSGAPGQEIHFDARPGVLLTGVNGFTNQDTINLEGASYVVVEGFRIVGTGDPATHRAGVRAVGLSAGQLASHVTVRRCAVDLAGRWGVFSGFVDDMVVEDCVLSRAADEHGVYVSNSGDRPIIRRNRIFDNHSNGIHMNGDASLGGDGVISDALVERNVVFGNGDGNPAFGAPGGSGINCDGLRDSILRNNLLFGNHKSGISLYREDGGLPSSGNLVAHNTVVNADDARWCMNVKNGSRDNVIVSNVFYNAHPSRGSIDMTSDCLPGTFCDFNAVEDRFSLDDVWIGLAAWQAATGFDAASYVTTPAALFEDAVADDYRLRAGSPALDAGDPTVAVADDLFGLPRPSGASPDAGAVERCAGPGHAVAFGAGLPGGNGQVPLLFASGCPTPGALLHLGVQNAAGGATALLVLGTNEVALPFLGGTLLVDPAIGVPHALLGPAAYPGVGAVGWTFAIPADPTLIGATISLQELVADPTGVQGATLSRGLRLTFG